MQVLKKLITLVGIGVLLAVPITAQEAETTPEADAPVACVAASGPFTADLPEPIDVTAEDTDREGWELVWQDEFAGEEIDLTRWVFDRGGNGFGNNELQYYSNRPENAFIEDGKLVIQALEERHMGRNYTSAKLWTQALSSWQYGRIDIRAKLPYGQGIWPAFWMLPDSAQYGGWPSSGEIDIMEMVGHQPAIVHGTLHYGESVGSHVYTGTSCMLEDGIFADDFHTFSIIWEAEAITWYVDGIPYARQTDWHTGNAPYPAPFDQPFYLIMNMAIGGDWPGNPDETTEFPQRLEVDYVRIYQEAEPE